MGRPPRRQWNDSARNWFPLLWIRLVVSAVFKYFRVSVSLFIASSIVRRQPSGNVQTSFMVTPANPSQSTRGRVSRRLLVTYPRAIPIALFALVLCVTALSIFAIERGEERRIQAQLGEQASAIASALERRVNANSSYLRAGAALFATLDEVPRERFDRFVGELRLDSDYRGAEGMGWAPAVAPGDVAAWEARFADALPGNVRVQPMPGQGEAYALPVTYLQPDTERNRRALGYNMYSEPTRRAAMDLAIAQARPVASGRIVLLQEGEGSEPGFIIYMPVFTARDGSAQLRGFIYSPFNAADFVASALELEAVGNVVIRLYDRNVGPDHLLASTGELVDDAALVTERVQVANREWALQVGSPEPWVLSTLSLLTMLFGLMVATLLMMVVRLLTQQAIEDDAALSWLEEQNSIRNSLTRELNHRVKNTLANVLSIIALTRRRAASLDEFAQGLDGRIRALSATHDLLTNSEWGTTPLRDVIEAELAPYSRDSDARLELQGPHIELAPNDALSLGLAVHELATNAAKYGALSRAGGGVDVHWRKLSDTLARVEWRERGGPEVKPQTKRGFGTDLIQKIVAHELGNPVDLRFEPGGVECMLTIPLREPKAFAMRAAKRAEQVGAMLGES